MAALLWSAVTFASLFGLLCLRDLPDRSAPDRLDDSPPTVSVIVPARDEMERIERTVRHLLAQTGVAIQLIVVDDRSADGTSEILARLAATDDRLTVVRVDEVPDRWLGKCHACQVGANHATGEWLLFTDADAWCSPRVIGRAITRATADRADHLCLLPGLGKCTVPGQAVVLFAVLGMLGIAFAVNCNLPGAYVGVGAFSLVRREAYDAIGGHETLRMEVIDDFALGYHVRRLGRRSRIYAAVHDVNVRWAHSARSFVAVLEKNMFAKLRFSVVSALANVLLVSGLWVLPLIGAFVQSTSGLVALAAMLSATIPASIMARRYGWPWPVGLLTPLSLPILVWATVYSAVSVMCRGGIQWRETFYPLATLRGK